ncbi:alkaline phosphatase PafA [Leadbetterella sp. DM7]|uniref:alkaline phosphatase PafA n=1 Tax=Leadbetterella sp. DM7 TaxID=3235085 RepID=UPI00349ECD61
MMRAILWALLLAVGTAQAQERPKLVVGVIVDQMRADYFYRYYDQYSEGGFKRLLREGYNCRNHHYHYALTVTAAGHASVYTGSSPSIHGIIGNDWYDPRANRRVYCVGDSTVETVGSTNPVVGKMSPRNLQVSTITDQLRVTTQFRSKVIGIALKDRGAILPAGHAANAAYWFDTKTGNWVSSTYYQQELPSWVQAYNNRKRPSELLLKKWETLLPADRYTASTADDQPYEMKFTHEKKSAFPYDLAGTPGDAFSQLAFTPHGNTLTKEMALEALKHENLGKGPATDFLAISFSSPDYAGHGFGPNSVEVQDVYLRLDKDIAEILGRLDESVGKGNYLFFISADHGVMDTPEFWTGHHLPAGRIDYVSMNTQLKSMLKERFGDENLLKASENFQLYLDADRIESKKIDEAELFKAIRKVLLSFDGVKEVIDLKNVSKAPLNASLIDLYRNVYHSKRSGDIQIVPEPGWIAGPIAANHGTPYAYDTHIPLLFFGWKIKPGETYRKTSVADTAPTLAALLSILEPSGNVGAVIEELFR